MKYRNIMITSVLALGGSYLSYQLGSYSAIRGMSNEIQATQAMLSFNHLKHYEEISVCFSKGLYQEAEEKVSSFAVNERELLAELLQTTESEWLTSYIQVRSNESIDSLMHFKSTRGHSWIVPSC